MITELIPVFDSRKSFYKKAHVIQEEGKTHLKSYSTIVATIEAGQAVIHGDYSMTTWRHVKDFLYQNGFEIGTKNELLKWYF